MIQSEITSNSILTLKAGTYFDDHSKLDQFNLNELLISGSKLLSSNTQKYDLKDNESGFSMLSGNKPGNLNDILTEKIHQQRKLLNQRLGIDVGGAAKLDTTHIFSDYDLLVSSNSEANQRETPDATTSNASDSNILKRKVDASDFNQIKREDVVIKQEDSTEDISSACKKLKKSESFNVNANDVPVELNSDEIDLNHVKSLELFTQWLLNKLFDSDWEIRHGAATCLREIIKGLVYSLMRYFKEASFNNSFEKDKSNLFLHLNWFQDCLVKMFSVIALDRFADYVGDEAVAPVREVITSKFEMNFDKHF